MTRQRSRVLAGALAVVLLSAGCSTGRRDSDTSDGPAGVGGATVLLNGQTATDHGSKDVPAGGSQPVEVDSFYFNPTVFKGKAGEKLTLTLTNESKIAHNFSLSEQSIDRDVPAGATVTVSLAFPSSGTLVFFCKIHRSTGMLGGLRVESG